MKQQASTCTMMLYQVILADTQNNSWHILKKSWPDTLAQLYRMTDL
jgi:hypothetical protein